MTTEATDPLMEAEVQIMEAYLLGHTLQRRARAGRSWWTVDDGPTRFASMGEASSWVRRHEGRSTERR